MLMIAPSFECRLQNVNDERIVRAPNVRKARCRLATATQRSDCDESPKYHAATSDPQARPKPIETCCNELARLLAILEWPGSISAYAREFILENCRELNRP